MTGNLFEALPAVLEDEDFALLAEGGRFRLLHIVSTGQATPPGQWYDQEDAEWVVVLKGRAHLRIAGEDRPCDLGPGDYVLLPAHCRHRVEWTDPQQPTVWLALHHDP